MIRINHINLDQYVAVTASEFCSLPNPVFLWVFEHEVTNDLKKVFLTDISPNPKRFNLFEINGLFFESVSWYKYRIYEAADDSNDSEETLNLVQSGRLFVYSEQSNFFQQPDNPEIKFTEYEG